MLINKETLPGAAEFTARYMKNASISLLDGNDREIYVACERLEVKSDVNTIADQTYTIEMGGRKGRKVKFETDATPRTDRVVLVVETWAEVYEIQEPDTGISGMFLTFFLLKFSFSSCYTSP